jgi:hypothetical protein
VKTCKSLLKKAKASGEDPLLAFLDWRNLGTSPVQRLMGRRTRTLLPTHQSLLKPREQNGTKKKLGNRKAKQVRLCNKKCKPLEPLQSGCAIKIKLPGDNRWSLGTCVRALDNPSFEVEVCGRRYRRHLRATKVMAPPPNAKDSQIEPSEPIETDLTPSLPVVEHSTPTNPITHETGNENLASSSGSNGGRTPSESNAGQEETIPRRTTRVRRSPDWHKDYERH